MSRRLASTSLRLLHRGNTHLADGRWSVLAQQRAQDQPQCRQTERAESGYIFAPMYKEEWNDRTRGAHQHGDVAPGRVRAFPVQPSNHTNKGTSQIDRGSDVQIEIHRTGRRIVQTPEHQEQANEQIREPIHEYLASRAQRRLPHLFAQGQNDILRNHSAPAEQIRTVDGHRSEEHTSELQSRGHLVCRLLLEKKKRDELNYYS